MALAEMESAPTQGDESEVRVWSFLRIDTFCFRFCSGAQQVCYAQAGQTLVGAKQVQLERRGAISVAGRSTTLNLQDRVSTAFLIPMVNTSQMVVALLDLKKSCLLEAARMALGGGDGEEPVEQWLPGASS